MRPSRRDVLASFLGSAVAAAACRRAPPRPVPVSLTDDLSRLGHQLRGAPLPRAKEISRAREVLVIGGGVAGLSAGWRLAATGVDFELLEVDQTLGGTAQGGENAVSAFPWGAHYLPAPLSAQGPVPRLLGELGLIEGSDDAGRPRFAEAALVREPEERLFYRGLWTEGLYLRAGASQDDLAQLERFEAAMRELARARDSRGKKVFAVPTASGSQESPWRELDQQTMAQWLDAHGYTSPRLRWLVDYACRDDYGLEASGTSAWAALWYFAARQTGDERSEGYLSWPEGNHHLVKALAAAIPVERRTRGALVHTVEQDEGGLWHAHAVDGASGGPLHLTARQVVLAVPRFVARHVLASWRASPPDFVTALDVGPWVVANVTLREAPPSRGFPLSWDNVLYESKSLGYVSATHQRQRARDEGPTVWTWYYPLTGPAKQERERLLSATAQDYADVLVADLTRAHPGFDRFVTQVDVRRWGHAMVRPVPGLRASGALEKAQASLGGSLHFAHTELGGLALFEEANHFGVRAAQACLQALGRREESWL
ncbi:MAG: NAD(P)-binding protein [Myxococcaceae bacterium]|nr:NAD(P)-binding protein [Myxococcaceae bacterium]